MKLTSSSELLYTRNLHTGATMVSHIDFYHDLLTKNGYQDCENEITLCKGFFYKKHKGKHYSIRNIFFLIEYNAKVHGVNISDYLHNNADKWLKEYINDNIRSNFYISHFIVFHQGELSIFSPQNLINDNAMDSFKAGFKSKGKSRKGSLTLVNIDSRYIEQKRDYDINFDFSGLHNLQYDEFKFPLYEEINDLAINLFEYSIAH